jgi:hypothetical protein
MHLFSAHRDLFGWKSRGAVASDEPTSATPLINHGSEPHETRATITECTFQRGGEIVYWPVRTPVSGYEGVPFE